MRNPLVSIVVSSYNRPHMLTAALMSVVGQTYTELEILVQDDSTNESCRDAVSCINDDRIRYTKNEPSLGTVGNLRAGYLKCSGRYFSTLNDDDLYAPDYIETMVRALESDAAYSLAFCDHWLIDGEGAIDERGTEQNSTQFGRSAMHEGSVPNPLGAGLIAKSVPGMFAVFRTAAMDLNDFPDEVSSGYDYWLTYLGVRDGYPIYYNPKRLTYYRVHQGSQTSSFSDPNERLRSLAYNEYMHVRFLEDIRLATIHPTLRQRLAQIYSSTGSAWLRLSRKRQAWLGFIHSLQTRVNATAVIGCILCCIPFPFLQRILNARQDRMD